MKYMLLAIAICDQDDPSEAVHSCSGKDAFHRVPLLERYVRDAVERVLTNTGGMLSTNDSPNYHLFL